MQPDNTARHRAVNLARRIMPARLVRYRLGRRTPEKTVLLTFDDGPYPPTTPAVLDALDRYKIKALFFVPGRHAELGPGLLQEVSARGHVIGNHSFAHAKGGDWSRGRWRDDLRRCQDTVEVITGKAPLYFRPPFGKITPALLAAALSMGLRVVKWSFDVGDSSFLEDASPDVMADRWVSGLRGRDIVLLHDKSEKTAQVLGLALPRLIEKGFRFDGLEYL
jgi:peptidoglycan/xylan/chitin deacetylase (PgdA/CDA1 family)